MSTRARRVTRNKPVVETPASDEDEEQLEAAPATPEPKKRAPRAKSTRKKVISEDEDEAQEEEYTPQPAAKPKRGRPARASVAATTSTPKRGPRKAKVAVKIEPTETEEEEVAEEEQHEAPKGATTEDEAIAEAEVEQASARAIRTQLNQPVTPPESPAPQTPTQKARGVSSTPLAEITNNLGAISMTTPKSDKNMGDISITPRQRQVLTPPEEPAGPKPRIVITHLVMMNFKSYAGRQEVGPFHSSFTSVVGPNGSGKSNVIDSLLFVFGFRASKMRQGKLSALIHNSAGHPNLEFCEVEVHFQEVIDMPSGTEVVPNSTLVIARRAFKNNSSNYYINGKTSNYTIVTTLLRERGVDLDHKRFLILQGEVESIAQMKPKAQTEHDDGLLEYLEDIIGTSNYKAPIEESAAEVEAMNEVCLEKSNRVAIVEKEKNGLEGQKNAAVQFIQNENELAMKQATLYQIFIHECGQNIEITSDSMNQLQIQLNEELEKHQGNEDGMKKLEKKYKHGLKEYESLEKQTLNIVKESQRFEKDNVKFQEKKKFLTTKQKKLEKTTNSSRLQASEATGLIERFTDDVTRTSTQVAELEGQLTIEEKELQKIRDELKHKTQGLSDEISSKQRSLEPWNAKINEKESTIAVTQSELDIVHEKANASKRAFEEVQAKIASTSEKGRAKEAELRECQAEQGKLAKEAQKLQAQYNKMIQKEPELHSTLSTSRQKADEAKSSLSSTQNQGNVLNGLMRLKDSGRIEGFHGRLGNLGTIDQKYDVAISTACPSLSNIVVDNVDVGQSCIDHLRKNNLGRAKFILLDRLPKRDMGPIQTPENAPRLFDLVKPKSEIFSAAFYSVLQDTLVAPDLASANRIAYGAKRWRVVTLDGQLIDKSGTMSGGGSRPSSGGMSSKLVADTTPAVVAKLEAERDTQEQTYRQFQQQKQDLEDKLKIAKDSIPQLEVRMSKIQLEIDSAARNLMDSQKRVAELNNEARPATSDGGQIKVLEKKISGLEAEIAKLKKETAGVENEIKTLQDKIMEIGGIRLRSQKSTVDGIREKMETLMEEMTNAEVALSKAEKTKQKSEKAEASGLKELEDATAELEALEEEIANHGTSARKTIQKAEEAQDYLARCKEELEAVKVELDEKTSELNETRAVEIEMKNTLEEHQKAFAENQKRLKYWSEKMGKLSLQSIADIGEEEVEGHALPEFSKDELADMDKDELKSEISVLEEKLQNVNVELGVLKEYRRRVEEHNARSQDLATSVASRDASKKRCDDLRKRRLDEFMEGFSIISLRLKEMYQMITMGGNAELELVDSLDPFAEGILFSVMPPKKSWKNISNLSGGEKTLSSLALVFALHHYKPTPLYVMDEIDAALDFRNVSIVASYIKERTKNAQFIVISLRNNMFELAARLVGVYKVNQMTKSVTIENQDFLVR